MFASELAVALLDRELARDGMSAERLGVLSEIARSGPLTPTALSEGTGLPPATLRDRIAWLQKAGWVERSPNPRDGRSSLVQVTEDGRAHVLASGAAVGRALARIEQEHGPLDDLVGSVVELRSALAAANALASEEETLDR